MWSIKTITRFTGIQKQLLLPPHALWEPQTWICFCFQQTRVPVQMAPLPHDPAAFGGVINEHQNRHLGKGSMQQDKKSKKRGDVPCRRPRRRHCAGRVCLCLPTSDGRVGRVSCRVTNSSDAALLCFLGMQTETCGPKCSPVASHADHAPNSHFLC